MICRLTSLFLAVVTCMSGTAVAQSFLTPPAVCRLDTLYNTQGCDMQVCGKGPYVRNDTLFLYECYRYYREFDGAEIQRVYIDRDTCSDNFSRLLERVREDSRQNYVNRVLKKWRGGNVCISGHDMGIFRDDYMSLYSAEGEIMTSTYMTMPLHVTDSTIMWTESDSWLFAIQKVRYSGRDSISIDVLSESLTPGTFCIKTVDRERGVIRVEASGGAHIGRTFFVSAKKFRNFPLLVFDCDCVPDSEAVDFVPMSENYFSDAME